MKPSRNDPFDLNLCIRGLGNLLTAIHSDLYEYVYYLTFRRSMRAYRDDFPHPYIEDIEHMVFFENTGDPYVSSCLSAHNKIAKAKIELSIRWGIDELEDLENESIIIEELRFRPYLSCYKNSKSYKRMTLIYERSLIGIIESLYLYACALTAQSNKIPLVLKRQFKLDDDLSLRLLNEDDNNVSFLKTLIVGLKEDLLHFQSLLKEREDKAIAAKANRELKEARRIAQNKLLRKQKRSKNK